VAGPSAVSGGGRGAAGAAPSSATRSAPGEGPRAAPSAVAAGASVARGSSLPGRHRGLPGPCLRGGRSRTIVDEFRRSRRRLRRQSPRREGAVAGRTFWHWWRRRGSASAAASHASDRVRSSPRDHGSATTPAAVRLETLRSVGPRSRFTVARRSLRQPRELSDENSSSGRRENRERRSPLAVRPAPTGQGRLRPLKHAAAGFGQGACAMRRTVSMAAAHLLAPAHRATMSSTAGAWPEAFHQALREGRTAIGEPGEKASRRMLVGFRGVEIVRAGAMWVHASPDPLRLDAVHHPPGKDQLLGAGRGRPRRGAGDEPTESPGSAARRLRAGPNDRGPRPSTAEIGTTRAPRLQSPRSRGRPWILADDGRRHRPRPGSIASMGHARRNRTPGQVCLGLADLGAGSPESTLPAEKNRSRRPRTTTSAPRGSFSRGRAARTSIPARTFPVSWRCASRGVEGSRGGTATAVLRSRTDGHGWSLLSDGGWLREGVVSAPYWVDPRRRRHGRTSGQGGVLGAGALMGHRESRRSPAKAAMDVGLRRVLTGRCAPQGHRRSEEAAGRAVRGRARATKGGTADAVRPGSGHDELRRLSPTRRT